jgi:hypothetical protein
MSYLQELMAHYSAVNLRLNGPPRRQFIPVPKPAPMIAVTTPGVPMTESECIAASIRLSRDLIARACVDKKVAAVCRATAHVYGVPLADLLGHCRLQRLVVPRHVAMTIAKALLDASNREIGRVIGGRDPGAVLNGTRKYGAKVAAALRAAEVLFP